MGNDVIEYNITVKKVPSVVLREGVIDKLAYMPILNYKYRTISTVPIKWYRKSENKTYSDTLLTLYDFA